MFQNAREVKTNIGKTCTTFFFPVGEEIQQIFAEWVKYLRKNKLWGNHDPLFPATQVALGEDRRFRAVGLDRKHWSSATAIREIFRESFQAAGLDYFNPHSVQDTLVQLGHRLRKTPEEFKVWSLSLGHEGVLTTLVSYGSVDSGRQAEIMRALAKQKRTELTDVAHLIADAVANKLAGQSGSGNQK